MKYVTAEAAADAACRPVDCAARAAARAGRTLDLAAVVRRNIPNPPSM